MYYYKIKLNGMDTICFDSEKELNGDDEIIDYALEAFILDVDDGDPYLVLDYTDTISEAEYKELTKETH